MNHNRTILRFLIAITFGFAVSAMAQQNPRASEFAAATIAEALATTGVKPEMQQQPFPLDRARLVIRTRLSPRLLSQAVEISGISYLFVLGTRSEAASVLVLRYPTADICGSKMKLLQPLHGVFHSAEILTKFSAVQLGTQLIISFTENSGDSRMVNAISSLPERFATDQKLQGPSHIR